MRHVWNHLFTVWTFILISNLFLSAVCFFLCSRILFFLLWAHRLFIHFSSIYRLHCFIVVVVCILSLFSASERFMFCRRSRSLPTLMCHYCRIWRSSSFNRTYHSSYHVMLQSNLLLYFGLSIWVVLFSLFSCVPRTANSLNRIYQPLCDTIFYCKTYCHAHITFISFDSGNAIKWIQLLDCSQTLARAKLRSCYHHVSEHPAHSMGFRYYV